MKKPRDTRECYQRMGATKRQFEECAKCGHHFIDWVRKAKIEEENMYLKQMFDKLIAKYNEKKLCGIKGLKKPTLESVLLLIQFNCNKNYHATYNSTCPNKCCNGSCKLCYCLCSLVVTISNYSAVRIASMNLQQSRKSHNDEDDAHAFLKVGAEVQ
jgi:hypothetical protein